MPQPIDPGAEQVGAQNSDITGQLIRQVGRFSLSDRVRKIAKVALAAVDSAGGVFAWANPAPGAILVDRVVIDVTTEATGACTINVGPAANATTANDTLVDGLDVGTAAILTDNLETPGTNGKAVRRVPAGEYVTASVATGASAGIVGSAYISYYEV